MCFGGYADPPPPPRHHSSLFGYLILGQKVNVKFFTVDPYSAGTGVPRTFLELGNIQKHIFLKIKTSIIKSVKISIKYSLLQNLNQISLHLIINTRHREASDYQIRLFLDDFPNGLFSIEIDQVKFSTQNNLENEIEDISMFKDDRGQQWKYLTLPPLSPLYIPVFVGFSVCSANDSLFKPSCLFSFFNSCADSLIYDRDQKR